MTHDNDAPPSEITLRLPHQTLELLSCHAERDNVTTAVVAQRWIADRALQEKHQRSRTASLAPLSSDMLIGHGMGGYLDAVPPKEP